MKTSSKMYTPDTINLKKKKIEANLILHKLFKRRLLDAVDIFDIY